MQTRINSHFGKKGHYTSQYSCMNDDICASSNLACYSCFDWTRFWVFNVELRLNLGYRLLRYDSRTKLESVPRFAEIWKLFIQFSGWFMASSLHRNVGQNTRQRRQSLLRFTRHGSSKEKESGWNCLRQRKKVKEKNKVLYFIDGGGHKDGHVVLYFIDRGQVMWHESITKIQWGSEIWPFKIRKHLKTDVLKLRFQMVGLLQWL